MRENGHGANCITTPHNETPPGAPLMMDTVYYGVKVQGLTFPLGVSVLERFLIQLPVLFVVQYYILGPLLLCWATSITSHSSRYLNV